MPFASGEKVRASKLNRIQPTTYIARSSGDVTGAVTDTDVTGATITLTTLADNAIYDATAFFDFDLTGAVTTIGIGKLSVDGVLLTPSAFFEAEVTTDRATPGQLWRGTLAAAGSHTLKLTVSLPANMAVRNPHTVLHVMITEVV